MSLAIEAFLENARAYCDWFESSHHDVRTLRQTLLSLMQGIPYLITNDACDACQRDFPRRSHTEWTQDQARMSDLPFQYYGTIFNPIAEIDGPPVVGDAHDDLADIYGELLHGLCAHDAGATIYAVDHWLESYNNHWGRHAIGAMTAIESHLTQNDG